jgi:hypothetical protein
VHKKIQEFLNFITHFVICFWNDFCGDRIFFINAVLLFVFETKLWRLIIFRCRKSTFWRINYSWKNILLR